MQIESLKSYVLIDQHQTRVEVYDRDESNASWVLRATTEGSFHIGSLDVRIALTDVYQGTEDL